MLFGSVAAAAARALARASLLFTLRGEEADLLRLLGPAPAAGSAAVAAVVVGCRRTAGGVGKRCTLGLFLLLRPATTTQHRLQQDVEMLRAADVFCRCSLVSCSCFSVTLSNANAIVL